MQKKGGAADDAAGQKPPGARVEHEHGPPGGFPFGAENRGEGAGVLGEPRGDKPAAGDSGAGAVPVRRAGKAHGRGHALCPGAAGRGHDARARRALCGGGLRAGRADRGLARHAPGLRAAVRAVRCAAADEPQAQRFDVRAGGGPLRLSAAAVVRAEPLRPHHGRGGRTYGDGALPHVRHGPARAPAGPRAPVARGDHQPLAPAGGRAHGVPAARAVGDLARARGAAVPVHWGGLALRRGDGGGRRRGDGADAGRHAAGGAVSSAGHGALGAPAGAVRPAGQMGGRGRPAGGAGAGRGHGRALPHLAARGGRGPGLRGVPLRAGERVGAPARLRQPGGARAALCRHDAGRPARGDAREDPAVRRALRPHGALAFGQRGGPWRRT